MSGEHQLWDQQEGEPDSAYAHFLIYRNLGPARSLDAACAIVATKSSKSRGTPKRASGTWTKECAEYRWPERAAAWDIDQLRNVVPGSIAAVFGAIDEFARVTLAQLQSGKVKPKSWAQVMEAIGILVGFISPETAKQAMDQFRTGVGAERPDAAAK